MPQDFNQSKNYAKAYHAMNTVAGSLPQLDTLLQESNLDSFLTGYAYLEPSTKFQVNGVEVEDIINPASQAGRSAALLSMLTDYNEPQTLEDAAKRLYLLFRHTDIGGLNAHRTKLALKGPVRNYAKELEIEDESLWHIINSHFEHLDIGQTNLVAEPYELVEACLYLLKANEEFKKEYIDWVRAIDRLQKKSGMVFSTYLIDYLVNVLFESNAFAYKQKTCILDTPLGSVVEAPLPEKEWRDIAWNKEYFKEENWLYARDVLLKCYKEHRAKEKLFFDPDKIFTHAGILREFKGRYENVEKIILADKGGNVSSALVLGCGLMCFEAVDSMRSLGLERIYGVDILEDKGVRLAPREFKRYADGNLVGGHLRHNIVGTYFDTYFMDAPDSITGLLPEIKLMDPEDYRSFLVARDNVKRSVLDITKATLNPEEFENPDVVYLRGTLCLFKGKMALNVLENAIRAGNPEGSYLVFQDMPPMHGYPVVQGAIVKVEKCGDNKYLISPKNLRIRPIVFDPDEQFFRYKFLQTGEGLAPAMIDYWLQNGS